MNDNMSDARLRALLRTGDPAADGNEPSAEETARLRRLTLNQVPDRNPLRRWLPIAAAAVLIAAIIVMVPSGPGEEPLTEDPVLSEADLPARQQIQFATEKGTRIIWVLDPNLTL